MYEKPEYKFLYQWICRLFWCVICCLACEHGDKHSAGSFILRNLHRWCELVDSESWNKTCMFMMFVWSFCWPPGVNKGFTVWMNSIVVAGRWRSDLHVMRALFCSSTHMMQESPSFSLTRARARTDMLTQLAACINPEWVQLTTHHTHILLLPWSRGLTALHTAEISRLPDVTSVASLLALL